LPTFRHSQEANLPTGLSNEQLHKLASHGAKARLVELRAEVAALLRAFPAVGGAPQKRRPGPPPARARRRGKLSAAGRRRIAEAQRKRWAALKQKSAGAEPRRSRMSAAAKKAVSIRMKKYWAERRKAKASKK
jgi:hypothetical protein